MLGENLVTVFAYQCLDNVKVYKYAKCDKNIPCGSIVMSTFPEIPLPTKMMLFETSLQFCESVAGLCLNKKAKPPPTKHAIMHVSGRTML